MSHNKFGVSFIHQDPAENLEVVCLPSETFSLGLGLEFGQGPKGLQARQGPTGQGLQARAKGQRLGKCLKGKGLRARAKGQGLKGKG